MSKNTKNLGAALMIGITAIAGILGLSIVMAIPIWLLWNWLMPMIFGLTKLTLIQSWGLAVLANCLFKPVSYEK